MGDISTDLAAIRGQQKSMYAKNIYPVRKTNGSILLKLQTDNIQIKIKE